jgi:hypothetical protein
VTPYQRNEQVGALVGLGHLAGWMAYLYCDSLTWTYAGEHAVAATPAGAVRWLAFAAPILAAMLALDVWWLRFAARRGHLRRSPVNIVFVMAHALWAVVLFIDLAGHPGWLG